MSKPNNNIQWRNLGIVFAGLVILWLIFNQLPAANGGMGYGHMGNGHMNFYLSTGPSIQDVLLSIFSLALKALWVLLIIALFIGLFQVIRQKGEGLNLKSFGEKLGVNGVSCPACGENLKEDFKFCPNCKASLKESCGDCGKELLPGWNCCPNCGKEVLK